MSPILGVFLIVAFIALLKFGEMSKGGGDAGMIGAFMCMGAPFVVTILFAIPYGLALLLAGAFK